MYIFLAHAAYQSGSRLDGSSVSYVGVHLFHDRVVEVLVGEEGRPQDHDQAYGEHGTHEAAVYDCVHAVLLPPPGGPLLEDLVALPFVVGIAKDLLHHVEPVTEGGDGVVRNRTH